MNILNYIRSVMNKLLKTLIRTIKLCVDKIISRFNVYFVKCYYSSYFLSILQMIICIGLKFWDFGASLDLEDDRVLKADSWFSFCIDVLRAIFVFALCLFLVGYILDDDEKTWLERYHELEMIHIMNEMRRIREEREALERETGVYSENIPWHLLRSDGDYYNPFE